MDTIKFIDGKAHCFDDEDDKSEVLESLAFHLNSTVEFDDKVTFDDVWNYVVKDAVLYEVVFRQALGGFPLSLYINQYKEPPENIVRNDEQGYMNHLILGWSVEHSHWEDCGCEPSFEIRPDFGGWGPQGKHSNYEHGPWGLTFTPINNLKNLRIFLDTEIIIQPAEPWDNYKDIPPALVRSHRQWTWYDIVYGILFEISFMGSPEDQQEEFEKVKEAVEYANNHPESLVVWDDIKDEFLKPKE